MKRRFFIAGLIAAPAVAPILVQAAEPAPKYAMKRVVGSVKVTGKSRPLEGYSGDDILTYFDPMEHLV
jgi:hypothetical protein